MTRVELMFLVRSEFLEYSACTVRLQKILACFEIYIEQVLIERV